MSPGTGCGPDASNAGAETATVPSELSAVEYTESQAEVDLHSLVSRLIYARQYLSPLIAQASEDGPLPELGTPEWVAADAAAKSAAAYVAVLHYLDAAAMASLVGARDRRVAREDHREFLIAQREASYAISAAVDWTAQSRRPSHAELERRRAVVVVPR